jgi:hypothetical protein
VALIQKFVDTLVNGHPSLFRIDSAHLIETSHSHALLSQVGPVEDISSMDFSQHGEVLYFYGQALPTEINITTMCT